MNRVLIRKAIREGSVLWLACAAGLVSFCVFRVWIVGRLDSARFKQIVDLLPREWDRFSSVDFSWMVSYLGRVGMTFDEPMVLMLVAIWAIVRGSDVVSGELGRGTMEMILAQPVRRTSVFWSHTIVTVVGVVGLSALVWVAMWIGVQITSIKESVYPVFHVPFWGDLPLVFLPAREQLVEMSSVINPSFFWPGIVNLACLGFFFVGITSWISARDRYRWRTLGIVVGAYFVMSLFKIGGMSVGFLRWMMYLTIFSLYEPELHVRMASDGGAELWSLTRWNPKFEIYELGPLGSNLFLVVLGFWFLWRGAVAFSRRDLEAPI